MEVAAVFCYDASMEYSKQGHSVYYTRYHLVISTNYLREKLIKIGAKVVRHSRYIVFQMAELAVSRALFRDILDRIRQLRLFTIPARPG